MVKSQYRLALLVGALVAMGGLHAAAQAPPQEKLKALEARLGPASEAEKVTILNEMAYLVVRRDGPRGKALAEQALALAEKLGDQRGQATAHKNLGKAFMVLEKDAEGLVEMQRAHDSFVALGDRKEEASTLGFSGMMLGHIGKHWQAIAAAEQSLQIYRELKDVGGIAAGANNLGVDYYNLGDYQMSLKYCLEALAGEEAEDYPLGIANDLNMIGVIYTELKEYAKARETFQRALTTYASLGERLGVAKVHNNLGTVCEKLGDDDEALRFHQTAVSEAQQLGNVGLEAEAEHNSGIIFKKRKQYDQALQHYLHAVDLKVRTGTSDEVASSYHNIAEVYLLQGRHREALAYLEKARAIGLEAKSNEILDGVYRLTAQVCEATGDWKNAYANQVLYADTREAMLDSERSTKIAELQEKYEADKRGREIELLGKDNELLKKDSEIRRLALVRTRLVAGLLVAVTVLLVGATLLLFRRYLYLLAFWKKRSFVGSYRIEEEITSGGMGVIYRATSLVEPGRPVALKVIRDELASDDTQRQRFINEGKIIDSLEHPGIVKVLDRGEHAGKLYIAMELLEGSTLAALIARATGDGRPLPLPRCLALLAQLVDAVAAIHARGVIHRDISPSNVIVVGPPEAEQAKLLDFGLAKADTMTTLTQAGEILGTLAYLAPERIRLHQLTPASDTFSLGALAYELLTLSRPFPGDDAADVLRQLLTLDPVEPALLRPDVPTGLSALVMAMLAKDPTARPTDDELRHRIGLTAREHP
jgi:tetratricopeptide (TPR) repeat protein